MNLEYTDLRNSEYVRWKINMPAIKNNYDKITSFDSHGVFNGPVKILIGEKSIKVNESDYNDIFPKVTNSDFSIIKNAGHWLHIDNPLETVNAISEFLDKI